jgi:phosphoenolpyruvate carboxykinase (GTP)
MGAKQEAAGYKLPALYCVNWFRKDESGSFVWPGYGDNMRVLKWIIDRLEGKAHGHDTMFGVAPNYSEINWTGIEFSADDFAKVTHIDKAAWAEEFKLHEEHFSKLSHNLPKAMSDTLKALEARLETA